MPPAQFYHWLEVNVKMRMLNLGKPREVRKLDQNAAIELGADLLGEVTDLAYSLHCTKLIVSRLSYSEWPRER